MDFSASDGFYMFRGDLTHQPKHMDFDQGIYVSYFLVPFSLERWIRNILVKRYTYAKGLQGQS